MNKLKALEERLRKLEDEQSRQQTDLHDLEDIKRMEAKLKNLAEEMDLELSQPENLSQRTKKFQLEKEELKIATKLESELKEKEDGVTTGYVVCLMFNPKSPTEWSDKSGGGWRQRGKGTYYADIEEARKRYVELKKKWPDYPLKILKSI